jgi:hypothetical protein
MSLVKLRPFVEGLVDLRHTIGTDGRMRATSQYRAGATFSFVEEN